MKYVFLCVLALMAICSSDAQPVVGKLQPPEAVAPGRSGGKPQPLEEVVAGLSVRKPQPQENAAPEHSRQKRATCDLFSLQINGIAINNSACAAHCLVRGKRGGYCNDKAVCVCR